MPPLAATSPSPETTSVDAGTGLQPNVAAALASFFLLIGGIVFLVLEKKDQFVRFYAMQSVFLGGFYVALTFAMTIALMILHGVPLVGTLLWMVSIVIRLAIFALWLMLIVKAYSGKEWEIPYLGKLARQQLAGGGVKPA